MIEPIRSYGSVVVKGSVVMTDPFFVWVTSSLLCETGPTQPRNPWAGVRWRTVNPSIDVDDDEPAFG